MTMLAVPELAESQRTGFERGARRGKGWRQEPYSGPLDLLVALMPDYVETPALRLISDRLVAAVVATETQANPKYLAVSMGPQEGKSTLIAFAFPLWLWLRNPDLRIIIISYDNETSVRWGRMIKESIQNYSGEDALHDVDLHLDLRPGSEAVARLQLDGYRGSLTCVSLTGGISGKAGDWIILDDVVKDRATANSGAFKKLWKNQWRSAIRARLGPGAGVVMDHTRWAEEDPIGQQLKENGSAWDYLNIPAVVESRPDPNRPDDPSEASEAAVIAAKLMKPNLGSPNKVKDPLGRSEGEWLISARGRTKEQWEKTRADVGEADFWALWQGQPYPAAGGLFERAHFRYWHPTADPWVVNIPGRPGPDEDLRTAFRFVTVDLAASTRTSADWTVAAVWAVAGTGQLLLLDLKRVQVNPAQHWDQAVRPLAEKWQAKIYVEGSQYGTDLVYGAARAGAVIEAVHADVDKYTRAVPAAKRIAQGMVFFPPAAHWLPDYEDELAGFPTAAHDDQVDVTSYAHRVVGEFWVPPSAPTPTAQRAPEVVTQAFGGMGGNIATMPL